MLQAHTFLEIFEALPPQEQQKVKDALSLQCPGSSTSKVKKQANSTLLPQHRTVNSVYAMLLRKHNIRHVTSPSTLHASV